jgi:hypothetical protein
MLSILGSGAGGADCARDRVAPPLGAGIAEGIIGALAIAWPAMPSLQPKGKAWGCTISVLGPVTTRPVSTATNEVQRDAR